MQRKLTGAIQFGRELFSGWGRSNIPRLGASLAYYTVFAVAPLFLLTLSIAGLCFGEKAASQELFRQINGLVGVEGGRTIESVKSVKSVVEIPLFTICILREQIYALAGCLADFGRMKRIYIGLKSARSVE